MESYKEVDSVCKQYIPYFDDYCSNLVKLDNKKDIILNKISYNSEIKLKNIFFNKYYVYDVLNNKLDDGYNDCSDIKVIFGYNDNDVQVYLDNYFNISLCVNNKLNLYIKKNNEKYPLICFYSGKFNFKGKLFDYGVNNNLINEIIQILSNNERLKSYNFFNHLDDLLKKYFENNFEPKFTKSFSNIRDYMCTYKYLCIKLDRLKKMYSLLSEGYNNKISYKKYAEKDKLIENLKNIQVKKSRRNKELEKEILDIKVSLKSTHKLLTSKMNELDKYKENLLNEFDITKDQKNKINKLNKLINYFHNKNVWLTIYLILTVTFLIFVLNIIYVETPHVYHMYYHKTTKLTFHFVNISKSIFNNTYYYLDDYYNNLNLSNYMNINMSDYIDNLEDFNL